MSDLQVKAKLNFERKTVTPNKGSNLKHTECVNLRQTELECCAAKQYIVRIILIYIKNNAGRSFSLCYFELQVHVNV